MDLQERNELIRKMRFEDVMTLRAIGDHFGISRERVRQILGNTGGYITRDSRKEAVLAHPHLTDNEIAERLGLSLSAVNTYRSGTWHRRLYKNNYHWEMEISDRLRSARIEHELVDHMNGYCFLVYPDIKIKMTVAYTPWTPASIEYASEPWRFRTADQDVIDYYFMVIDPRADVFVVPVSEVKGRQHIVFCWPNKNRKSKWEKYLWNLDQLKES